MLQAKDICFEHPGRRILCNISLTIAPGEIIALLGANGCGKSTLLRILAGFWTASRGTVTLDGTELSRIPAYLRARRIAVMPQMSTTTYGYTVEEMIAFGTGVTGKPAEQQTAIAEAALRQMELLSLATRPCHQLSGGEYQRMLWAMAFAQQTDYMLLDEPLSAMDPCRAEQTMERLKSWPQHPGILLVTHQLEIARKYANRCIFLKNGSIFAECTPSSWPSSTEIRQAYI